MNTDLRGWNTNPTINLLQIYNNNDARRTMMVWQKIREEQEEEKEYE